MQKLFLFLNYIALVFQKAKKLGNFGGKMTKFEDIGVDLNKVFVLLKNRYRYPKGTCLPAVKRARMKLERKLFKSNL